MLRWMDAHESFGKRLIEELQSAVELAGLSEDAIQTFNDRFLLDGAATAQTTMRTWSIPVAQRRSYATLAACAVEGVLRIADDN